MEIDIETEKARLARYQTMYATATRVEDQINLNDRIFNQERRIKYLENSLANIDQRIDYSTVSFSLREKISEYANIALVKFSQLFRNLVSSTNSLFQLIFLVIPYAIAGGLLWGAYKFIRRIRE